MKMEISANSCRVCLATGKKLRSLYKPIDEGDEPPNKMLHLITGIQVEKINELITLPKNICKNCELSLSMAFEFRVNALKTQQIIMDYLKELNKYDSNEEDNVSQIYNSNDHNDKEYEEIMDLEPLDECENTLDEDITECNLENLNDDELANGGLINEEEEECEEQEHTSYLIDEHEENEIENYSDHHDNVDKEDEDIDEYEESQKIENGCEENDEQLEEILENEDQEFIPEHTNVNPKISKKSSTVLRKNEKTLGEKTYSNTKFNTKEIPRRGRKPANTTNQVGYICDICGNIYSKRGRMTEHRQRHDKELKFNCEVCSEKFYTRELLRKHMFSHSGGKPLKCEYCSRTFYYESVRKAHEAVHKGHKPYICDVCGKAFGYSHALKKHKLIHAEIKLYRCTYCNKDFRLQHHMKQHELTKLHQNAVRFAKSGNANYDDCVGARTNSNEIVEEGQNSNDILFMEEIAEDQLDGGS